MGRVNKAIYKPRGKAAEYGEYAVNLYRGCTHGCRYCYVPGCLRMSREEFHSGWKLREGILEQLDRDAARHPKDKPVFLSFTSDPYQPGAEATTREALKILNEHEINFIVLTKGGMRAADDFYLYKKGDKFGITLTTSIDRGGMEKKAAGSWERIYSLYEAKFLWGIETWVSFEPVIFPDETAGILKDICHYRRGVSPDLKLADHVKIGACSGDFSRVTDWKAFGKMMVNLCEEEGISYYLKEDLRRRMGVE